MYDLRDKKNKIRFYMNFKWKYLLYLLIGIVILFPIPIADFIGTWIDDFFGTIIDIIKNG